MDIDRSFVAALVREGSKSVSRAKGQIRPDYLASIEARKAYEWVCDTVAKHGKGPTFEEVESFCGVDLSKEAKISSAVGAEKIVERRIAQLLQGSLEDAIGKLEAKHPHDAVSILEAGLREIHAEALVEERVVDLAEVVDAVFERYAKIKAGERGIPLPWETVTDLTLGLWPEDLALFVARAGAGKTWITVLTGHKAWSAGYRVLFLTTEMSQESIATRFMALDAKVPHADIRSAKLSVFDEKKLQESADRIKSKAGFMIAGGDFDFRAASVDAYVGETKPDLVIVDGAYLLRGEGKSRFEQAAFVFDELKRVAKRRKVPIVVTTQLNRDAAKGKKQGGTENIALTDAAGWNADLIFALYQTDDMREDKRMIIRPMKVREGWMKEIECHWDFDTMNFSEVGESSEDSDFSIGLDSSDEDEGGDKVLF